ncbi:MAG TPA: RNA 2'-phosphotransferase [Methanosarcina sp.]|nr:RNA 2'-phosphotransferase [Methanosarcina sp.]
MNEKHLSKLLSLILRHKPETIGLTLDQNGWANVEELLTCLASSGNSTTIDFLKEVVRNSDKQRFIFSEDGIKIRANQGHSIQVELGLVPMQPPEKLYHGTATRFLESILQAGLTSQSRTHVHLSSSIETAISVGKRHGKPVVLEVDTKTMIEDGQQFFQSENGVWLTTFVKPSYISVTQF